MVNMARINAMTKTAKTATKTFKAAAMKMRRNGKEVDNSYCAVLLDETGAVVDRLDFETFTSAAKAETAGLANWMQASIDIDGDTAKFEERLKANIPKLVANERKRLVQLQAARQMVHDDQAKDVEEALKLLKSQAKAAKTGDDDNVLADLTAE